MTTWPHLSRRFGPLRVAPLLAAAWLGTAAPASGDVTAVVVGTELRVTGDAASNEIRLLQSIDGLRIEIWVGNTFLVDRQRALFTTIRIEGGGANDYITIDETIGIFTDTEITTILGGDGADVINGGSGAETIEGGAGNDLIDGGRAADTLRGDGGDDTFVWNAGANILQPSDGNDVIDGGDGTDGVVVGGGNLAETYSVLPNGSRVTITRGGGAISLDAGTIEVIALSMNGGDDTFIAAPGFPVSVRLSVNGGDGNDTITGGDGADSLAGWNGNDTLHGGPGNDHIQGDAGDDDIFGDGGHDTLVGGEGFDEVSGGDGDDRLAWNDGDGTDGSDDGEAGNDTLALRGTGAADTVDIGSVPFIGLAIFGLGPGTHQNVERVDLNLLGGDDVVSITATPSLLQGVSVDAGLGNDTISSNSMPLLVNGGPDGFDTLNVTLPAVPLDVGPFTIGAGGTTIVTYLDIEDLNLSGGVGSLPVVTIASPTSAPATSSDRPFITLAGGAADANGIQSVTWSNDRGGSGTASGTTAWVATDVPLKPGVNHISVSALDGAGNRNFDLIAVTVSTLTYSLAEGATGSFFDLDILLANPSATPAPVTVTFLREGGSAITQTRTLAPTSRTTIHVDEIPGLESQGGISTVVTSTAGIPIVVERTMFWDQSYYGSHGGTAVDGPRTRWLFAEGSEGFFNTFVLLANANPTAATATVTFLREGSTPFVKQVNVPGNARVTIAANGSPELVGRSFSIVVDSTLPIIAERAMYFGTARLFDGGHESAGVAEGAQVWFLAEGATGPFFETFILIGNPNPAAATVNVTYLTDQGESVVRTKTVPANGRLTINIEYEDPILANVSVSTAVVASQPVVVERAMYWPGPPSTWAEAHNSFGSTFVSATWGLAEGRVGTDRGFETYILLANPNTTAANVTITFLRTNGTTVVKQFTVNPRSRFNVAASTAAPELQNEAFGALIQVTNGLGIGVERAMYSNALGQIWAAGTNALATRLP